MDEGLRDSVQMVSQQMKISQSNKIEDVQDDDSVRLSVRC